MANMAGRDPIRTLAHATGLCRGARYFWARSGGGPRWCVWLVRRWCGAGRHKWRGVERDRRSARTDGELGFASQFRTQQSTTTPPA
jgi:hypothetical protein